MLTPELLRDRQKGSRCIHLSTDSAQVIVDFRISDSFAYNTDEHNEQHTRAGTEKQQMASVK